jgi:hypothetical protein
MSPLAFRGLLDRGGASPPIFNRRQKSGSYPAASGGFSDTIDLPAGRLIELVHVVGRTFGGLSITGEDFEYGDLYVGSNSNASRSFMLAARSKDGVGAGTNIPATHIHWDGSLIFGSVQGDYIQYHEVISTASTAGQYEFSVCWYDLGQLSDTNFVDA